MAEPIMEVEAVPPSGVTPAANEGMRNLSSTNLQASVSTMSFLKPDLCDSNYDAMRRHFFKTGKGCKPKLPAHMELNNRVLAQLYFLKEDGHVSWVETTEWFHTIFPGQREIISTGRLEHRVRRVLQSAQYFKQEATEDELDRYLNTPVNFDELPAPLGDIGLSRSTILNDPTDFTVSDDFVLTNFFLAGLETFRSREGLQNSFVVSWVKRLLGAGDALTDAQIRHKVSVAIKKIKTMKHSKQNVDEFLKQQVFDVHGSVKTKVNKCHCSETVSSLRAELSKLKIKIEKMEDTIKSKNLYIADLESKQEELAKTSEKVQQLNDELDFLEKKNVSMSTELSNVKKSKVYKRNCLLRKQNNSLSQKNKTLEIRLKTAESDGDALRNELKLKVNDLKNKIQQEQKMKSRLKKALEIERSLVNEPEGEEVNEVIFREDKHNQFTGDVRLTYMSLMGEANVSAQNCSKVVEIVCKQLLKKEVSIKDLPSASTVLNFANEAYHIAQHHVAQSIKESEHFTYATDGTSRQKKKFIERHVVLSNKASMSLGFCEVASDDAETLLSKTIDIIDELSTIYCTNEEKETKDKVVKEILKKMKCIMSDRAAVMKSFDRKVLEYKKDLLGEEDSSTHFLFCNAHFLLGLAHATEDALKLVQKDLGKLGRDLDNAFARFSSASAGEIPAFRLLRTAADVLGPRGDEKNGCREEWLAYCSTVNKSSTFTSFRSNRFNNIFENASAVINHHRDIELFLTDFASNSNLKLKSILGDLKDQKLLSLVAAVALFHQVFTGPYWKLMNSNTPYGAFPEYVSKMNDALNQWTGDFELNDLTSVFDEDTSLAELLGFISLHCDYDLVKLSFCEIAKSSHVVFQRQLADFLEGGVFGGVLDQEVKKILDTCPLTNLTGERIFGDFDYDLQKRRHASLHLRTTLNMWRRNKTTSWFVKQNSIKAKRLLFNARKYASVWKARNKEKERAVKQQIKTRIEDNMNKKREKEIKKMEAQNAILDEIIHQGGQCTTKEALDKLMVGPGALHNIKCQIKFRKIHGEKILLSGNLKTLYVRLCKHLGFDTTMPSIRKRSRRARP